MPGLHFTLDKTKPGNDHYHAMDVKDLARFVELAKRIQVLLGSSDHKAPIPTEAISRLNARRSIVLTKDVPAGHRIEAADLTCKRPGTGVSPLYWDEVLNKELVCALREDDVLSWQHLRLG